MDEPLPNIFDEPSLLPQPAHALRIDSTDDSLMLCKEIRPRFSQLICKRG
jgi:hypothetical protein